MKWKEEEMEGGWEKEREVGDGLEEGGICSMKLRGIDAFAAGVRAPASGLIFERGESTNWGSE